jgi:hypothetical protein
VFGKKSSENWGTWAKNSALDPYQLVEKQIPTPNSSTAAVIDPSQGMKHKHLPSDNLSRAHHLSVKHTCVQAA